MFLMGRPLSRPRAAGPALLLLTWLLTPAAATGEPIRSAAKLPAKAAAAPAAPSAGSLPEQGSLTLPWSGCTSVEVISGTGDVTVRARLGSSAVLAGKKNGGGPGCVATFARQGTTLQVNAAPANQPLCAIDLTLVVPPNVDVTTSQQLGALRISGVRGRLKAQIARGNAVVGGTFSHLEVDIGEGSMSVQGVAGGGEVKLGSGNLQIYYAPAATGSMALALGRGNATITAAGTVANEATAASNDNNPLAPDAGAEAAIRVSGHVEGALRFRRANKS